MSLTQQKVRGYHDVGGDMETAVFTFEMMGSRLVLKREGAAKTIYLDDLFERADGAALHWKILARENFVRYRAIMARKKSEAIDFKFD